MLLAELEIWHSRPIQPTRRVALGALVLPASPPPGFGGLLLAGVVSAHLDALAPDLFGELSRLITDLEAGRRIVQPRLRHRFQEDRHGLAQSTHRLVGEGDGLTWELEEHGRPETQILGAVYAAGRLPASVRPKVMDTIRRALRWRAPLGPSFVAHLTGSGGARWSADAFADPAAWALGILGFDGTHVPERGDIQQRFRHLLREAHPDHGGERDEAAGRIRDLSEARRILLA